MPDTQTETTFQITTPDVSWVDEGPYLEAANALLDTLNPHMGLNDATPETEASYFEAYGRLACSTGYPDAREWEFTTADGHRWAIAPIE